MVQFHGSETPEWLALLKQARRQGDLEGDRRQETPKRSNARKRFKGAADMLLYDAPAQKLPGGQGLAFDWSLLTGFRHEMPWGLAGGLTPDNVAEAIRVTGAPLVDASSGVESAPGVKDVDKIAAFCQAARAIMTEQPNSFRNQPDERGHFGAVRRPLRRRDADAADPRPGARTTARPRPTRRSRPSSTTCSSITSAARARSTSPTAADRGAAAARKIWFKRDELNHTGAHKINNCIGQILLAMRMGKTRIIAETGAGQHGVATATVCARFGLPCVIYMGAVDVARQAAQRLPHEAARRRGRSRSTSGATTLKDAMNEALRDWVANVHDTFYIIGTAAGPHPYPELVRDFQSVIGSEARAQMLSRIGRLPDLLVAAIGGGSNAIGLFHPFLDDRRREDARRRGGGPRARQAARREPRRRLPRHPPRQQDLPAAGRGRPDHRGALDQRRARLSRASAPSTLAQGNRPRRIYRRTDTEALDAFQLLLPHRRHHPRARASARASPRSPSARRRCRKDAIILANLCGRGRQGHLHRGRALGVEM